MKTIKKESPQAIEALLSRLSQTPSDPRQIRQNPGEEGVKQLVLSDVLRREAISRFPEDRMGQMKFNQSVMRMKQGGMNDEDIYRSLLDGTFEEKATANDPFSRFNR